MGIGDALRRSAFLILGFALAGCATATDMSDLRARVDNDEAKLHKLQSQSNPSGGDQLNSQMADLEARLDRQKARMESLRGRLDTIDHRIDQLRSQIATPAPQASTPPAQSTEKGVPPVAPPSQTPVVANVKAMYAQAMRDYQSGHFELSKTEFSTVVSTFPTSYLAGSAQFWIGQSLFYSKKYKDSIEAYDRLIHQYPDSGKKADAFYKRAMAYELMGDKTQALHYYKRILEIFPAERDLDEKAKRHIRQLE